MYFCSLCQNILIPKENTHPKKYVHYCVCCNIESPIIDPIIKNVQYSQLEDKIMDREKEWKYADITDSLCPNCNHTKAYYIQLQTRSADEGSTTFYRCKQCSHIWKEC
eukprot:GHVP01026389.1.p1 GENE.GHVP01026389.1~~GHVP01026389.1.p1  ORF type:complete len:108 (-),score=4.39 GHVP01026389.1:89-412(-)